MPSDWENLYRNKPLWERASSFLWDTLSWVRPQQLKALFPETIPLPDPLPPRLRRFALERLGIVACKHTFPVKDGSRFLLLEEPILHQLARWLGALAYTRPLRSVMQGEEVRRLKAELPGVYPEVLHELGWFLPDLPRLQAAVNDTRIPSVSDLDCAGWQLLFAHLSHLPHALLQRFRLRFSADMAACWHVIPGWTYAPEQLILVQRLLKRISPGDYDLCCS